MKITLLIVFALILIAAPAMAQPTPFAIGSNVCTADRGIRIMNTNVSWNAENSSACAEYTVTRGRLCCFVI